MNRPSWLTSLLEKGAVGRSAADRRIVNELITLGIVAIRSAGLRQTVIVADPAQFERWLQARYPAHALDPATLPVRAGNIVRAGSSKTGKSAHAVLPFLFKWFGPPGDLWTQMTRTCGMGAVLTDRLADLPLPPAWRLLTIENWETFQRANYTHAPVPVMVVYLSGNVAEILIEALGALRPAPQAVLHFGDYDWEGLYFFQRLQKVLPAATLYIPDNLEVLFRQFGKRALIDKQKRRAGFDMAHPACLPVIRLIEQFNAGLEQEIVALPETI
jgi:hypothetical protein